MGASERFAEEAARRGLDPDVRRFPEGTRTAADAAAAVGCVVGQIVKSLVFVADGEPVVVLTSGANRVDVGRLASLVGASDVRNVRKADADEVRAATGYAIGGTPPFGYPRPVRVVLDEDLLAFDVVWAAAGTPDSVFALTPDELVAAVAPLIGTIREEHGPLTARGR